MKKHANQERSELRWSKSTWLATVLLTVLFLGAALLPPPQPAHTLRHAIDQEYARRADQHLLKPVGNGINDISSIVRPYLPAGMPVQAAEAVLRSAGFALKGPQQTIFQGYGIAASIEPYAYRIVGRETVDIWLPIDPRADPGHIRDARAEILIMMP